MKNYIFTPCTLISSCTLTKIPKYVGLYAYFILCAYSILNSTYIVVSKVPILHWNDPVQKEISGGLSTTSKVSVHGSIVKVQKYMELRSIGV